MPKLVPVALHGAPRQAGEIYRLLLFLHFVSWLEVIGNDWADFTVIRSNDAFSTKFGLNHPSCFEKRVAN